MHTILIAEAPERETLAALARRYGATDSNVGKAKVAKADLRKTRRFIINQGKTFRCKVLEAPSNMAATNADRRLPIPTMQADSIKLARKP